MAKRYTIKLTYHMIKGNETAETYIELPISKERYEELNCEPDRSAKVWTTVRNALASLTRIQSYIKLGTWDAELSIEG